MLFKNSLKVSVLIILGCCLQLTACSLISKPKQWFDKEEDPREPAKLINLGTEKIKVQSVWKNSIGDLEEAHSVIRPYITGDLVYLTDAEGRVEAWQRMDGKRIWSVTLKEEITGGVNGGDDIVVVGTGNGVVIALSTVDGQEKWRTSVSSEVMALSQAKFGVIVARTNDSKVHALDVGQGNIVWKAGRGTPPLTLRGASEPKVVGDSVLVGYDDGKMAALSMRDGTELWETTVSVPGGRSELERMSDVDGEIAYVNGIVYAASFNGRVVAVDMDTGKILWTKDLSSHVGLSADESRVYVTDSDDSVWALDIVTGATLWRQDKLLYRDLTAPKVMGKYVVVGDFKGYLHWFSKEDGKLVGRENIAGDAIKVAPIIINDRAYVFANNGSFSVLQYR
ncbi:MAG: outer membrane protein assembly factor BamB [Gammaproteobacteria bacterium]|nr:outer membrane protein assembly factor BamB [Gammaproteobacteria bacterium]